VILLCLLLSAPPDAGKPPAKLDRDTLVKAARPVLAAIVVAGRENRRRPTPLKGDELTEYYVRRAAIAAGRLPEKQRVPGLLLALGVGLDDSPLMRKNPATSAIWKRVESDKERSDRLAVLGTPTMHGRHDLAQHFSVSMALTAVSGAKAAEAAGLIKELMDAAPGGSGFSFADLAADLSGVAFATWLLADPSRLANVEKRFTVAGFAVSPRGLKEDLSEEAFEKAYGGIDDPRFRKEMEQLRKKVKALSGYRSDGSVK
jgi:hypothetical protein